MKYVFTFILIVKGFLSNAQNNFNVDTLSMFSPKTKVQLYNNKLMSYLKPALISNIQGTRFIASASVEVGVKINCLSIFTRGGLAPTTVRKNLDKIPSEFKPENNYFRIVPLWNIEFGAGYMNEKKVVFTGAFGREWFRSGKPNNYMVFEIEFPD